MKDLRNTFFLQWPAQIFKKEERGIIFDIVNLIIFISNILRQILRKPIFSRTPFYDSLFLVPIFLAHNLFNITQILTATMLLLFYDKS